MPIISTSIIKLTNFPPTLPNVPPNYPVGPAPGKIQLLLNSNDNYLYHKFSPYTNYHDSLFAPILSNKQPFIYTYIDEKDKGLISGAPSVVKSLLSTVNITQGTTNDVVRVSKFLISSWGVQFIIGQLAIQRLAPFDETRIYNPLSPVLATIAPMTIGLGNRPLRHIEGGFLGLINSVTSTFGVNLQSGFKTPKSTVGDAALSKANLQQGKGLIRGTDANSGLVNLQLKWSPSTSKTSGNIFSNALNNLASSIGSSFKSFFGGAPKSKGLVRADDTGYYIMALGTDTPKQPWYASSYSRFGKTPSTNKLTFGISLATNTEASPTFLRSKLISYPDRFDTINTTHGLEGPTINGKKTGYDRGDKYTDVVGRQSPTNEGEMTNSDMLVQYAYYIQDANNFPSKISDKTSETSKKIQLNLQKIINNINLNTLYKATTSTYSKLLSSGNPDSIGYNVNFDTQVKSNQSLNERGVGVDYRSARFPGTPTPIDNTISSRNLRMATSFKSDGLNMLGILKKDRQIDSKGAINSAYGSWTEWKPYEDDLIAFFFYDVVNEKYIPFRATVKAISEGNTAFWDELRFIGRADQLYSYNGFSRTLSFTFNVVINSITELLPSWEKINYLASSVKPSNYTAGQKILNQPFNRFIVPPMFMLTIGDLYKYQPMVITSINVNIPDDASWETLNEDNSKSWSYLNGIITSPSLGSRYGQLPREVEIAITCNLLEKERSIVGGSHFGHAPRNDKFGDTLVEDKGGNLVIKSEPEFIEGGDVFLPIITELHKNFIINNDKNINKIKTITEQNRYDYYNNVIEQLDIKSTPEINTAPTANPTTTGNKMLTQEEFLEKTRQDLLAKRRSGESLRLSGLNQR